MAAFGYALRLQSTTINLFIQGDRMRERQFPTLPATLLALACLGSVNASAQTLDEVLGVRSTTTEAGRTAQARIDEIADETRDLLSEFKTVMKIVDGLRIYNRQQERLIEQQEREMAELNDSIDRVTVTERQITPLMERMINGLETFVDLDVPFLLKERRDRISFLRETMDRADVSVAEKFSQVMQAYQIENQYGTTIEAYSDEVDVGGGLRAVDLLKFGRIILVYQTTDGQQTGVWDNQTRQWVTLGNEFQAAVRDGLRMARQTMTPNLVNLPVSAPEAAE